MWGVARRSEGCWRELGRESRISPPGADSECKARSPFAALRPGCAARGALHPRKLHRAALQGAALHELAAASNKPRHLAALWSPPSILLPSPKDPAPAPTCVGFVPL